VSLSGRKTNQEDKTKRFGILPDLFVLSLKVKETGLGSFWTDITRSVLYILLPLSLVVSVFLVSQGVVQNFNSYDRVDLVQPITLSDGTVVTSEVVPQGPAAS